MSQQFDINDLYRILVRTPEYEGGHHLNRPFMSAYQIAIRFAEEFPNHRLVQELPLGGEGAGSNQSLAQQIARFLSQAIRAGTAGNIEGGFISHVLIENLSFLQGQDLVHATTSESAHTIFRVPR